MKKDLALLQWIYHRATKMVDGLQNQPYEERLKRLNLFDFTYRRIRGDLILVYKILHTPDHPLQQLLSPRVPSTTRTHGYSLTVPHSRLNCRRYFFAVRVCFTWNDLPAHVINSPSLAVFKMKLDAYMSSKPLTEPLH